MRIIIETDEKKEVVNQTITQLIEQQDAGPSPQESTQKEMETELIRRSPAIDAGKPPAWLLEAIGETNTSTETSNLQAGKAPPQ